MIKNATLWIPLLSLGLGAAAAAGWNEEKDTYTYNVVINHEEQYSVWFADRETPKGWKDVGFTGNKQECLKYIEEVWTDMRPLTWRKKMDGMAKGGDSRYKVVINHEEQYSIWFADREAPQGWEDGGFEGSKKECLDYIEEVWTDMRPLSWRKHWKEGK